MKTISCILFLLVLVSCGKDNKSGSRPEIFRPDPFTTDAEITSVTNTRNGLMVQGTQANFAIPVTNITDYFKSKNLVGVIYDNGGLRVKVFNALGNAVFNEMMIMRSPSVNVGDDVAAIDYFDSRGVARVIAVNTMGKVLLQISAQAIRAKTDYGVVAVTYRTATGERAMAMKASGQVLVRDNRNYILPRFTIDPYVLTLRHGRGVERIAH